MASSSDSDSGPSKRPELYWNRLPSIKILKPPAGTYSPRVDERCFTYCSQSIRGRQSSDEPWCRTICIRRVFDHEVRRAVATSKYNPATQSYEVAVQESDAKIPLPPEGQPQPATDDDESIQWKSIAGKMHPQEPLHWKEGWYLWMSKSRWAAQEKMDLMMLDLEKQAEWQKYKEKVNEEWATFEKNRQHEEDHIPATPDVNVDDGSPPPEQSSSLGQSAVQVPLGPGRATELYDQHMEETPAPPFPDSSSNSLLVHLPPSLSTPLNEQVENLFSPTKRLLSLAQESIKSGEQNQLAARLWEKAQSDAPLVLIKAAWDKVWKNINSSEGEES